jgi:hypothetical protein
MGEHEEAARFFAKEVYIALPNLPLPVMLHAFVRLFAVRLTQEPAGSVDRLEVLLAVRNNPACRQETKDRTAAIHRFLLENFSPETVASAQLRATGLDVGQTAEFWADNKCADRRQADCAGDT